MTNSGRFGSWYKKSSNRQSDRKKSELNTDKQPCHNVEKTRNIIEYYGFLNFFLCVGMLDSQDYNWRLIDVFKMSCY